MALGLTERLPALVRSRYAAAQATGALTFAASELSVVRVADVNFQLRYCPSLAKKPAAAQDSSDAISHTDQDRSHTKSDPFDNPTGDLFIAAIPLPDPTHVLVLNKFPIIKEHFILTTKNFKPQTHLLEELDLGITYQCLRAWEDAAQDSPANGTLFAFFNSGKHSGASQPHRHIQFLPVESMRDGHGETEWTLLADDVVKAPDADTGEISYFRTHRHLPFQHFGTRLPEDPTPTTLHQVYLNLYQQCLTAAADYAEDHPGSLAFHSTEAGDVPISYNLAVTTKSMVMCPRRAEGMLLKLPDEADIDFVALNGTLLGGTMMVKSETAYRALKDDGAHMQSIIEATTLPAHLRRNKSFLNL